MRRSRNRYGPGTFFFLLTVAVGLWVEGAAFPAEKLWKNAIGMEFVLIPAGAFMMGSPPGEPDRDKDEIRHPVTIRRPFYMLATEVTRGQWWAVMGKPLFRRGGEENNPVVKVSWYDCEAFLAKLNARKEGLYRFPTEAEWEYACRAGSDEAYAFGKTISCDRAMYGNNPLKSEECVQHIKKRGLPVDGCAPVKSYPPNPWGLYDMHGNVWEWCADWYGPYPPGAVSDPRGPEGGQAKIRRGGSWFKHGWQCRSANRNYAHPGSRLRNLGFRIVREVE